MSQINEDFEKQLREDERKKRRRYVFLGVVAMIVVIVVILWAYQRIEHKNKATSRQNPDTTSQHPTQ